MRSLRLLIPVILCVLLLACSGQTPAPLAQTTAVPENPVTEHAEDIISFATPTPEPTPAPTPTPTPTPTPEPTPVPTPELITNERLDSGEFDSFFNDALFVGDSLTLILSHYVRDVRNEKNNKDYMGEAKFLAATSMSSKRASENSVKKEAVNFKYRGSNVTLTEGIRQIGPKRVFLMFGLNDLCVRNWDDVLGYFGKIIDNIRRDCPDVEIVVEATLPVRKTFYNKQPPWNDFNIGLKALCEEKDVEFLDFTDELMDDKGFLRADLCNDGKCHLTIDGEKIWIRALRRYAAEHMLSNIVFETP
ncbi:MAG: GDSL-type esterase/lipase family protein [Clostridia bacterium]|nr:GDSL-type esterase/lipase family protein [Clostridia bacterium]